MKLSLAAERMIPFSSFCLTRLEGYHVIWSKNGAEDLWTGLVLILALLHRWLGAKPAKLGQAARRKKMLVKQVNPAS